MSRILKSVDYEVFGRVQGVCFRMYTEEKARKVGIVGWVKNTRQGTVTGQVQGPEDKVKEMLSHEPGKMKQFEVNLMTFDGIKIKQNEYVLNGVGVALKPLIVPDTFRIFNLQVPERNNILDKIECTPKKEERYLLEWRNNPQPQHAKLLKMHTKFINEPVLYMETEDTKTKQSHWWPTFEPTVQRPKPPYDTQSTHRNDFQKPNCILSRPVKHPSKLQPSYGIVPLASPQLPNRLPRIFQEQLTFNCNYNARETPCIPYQGKKQGTIVLTEKKPDRKIMPSIQESDFPEDLKSEKGAPVENGVTSVHVDSFDAQKTSSHSDAHLSKPAMNLETKVDPRTPEMDQESSELPQTDKVNDTFSPSKTISLSKPPVCEAAPSIPDTQVV